MARIILSKASYKGAPEVRFPSYHSAGETVNIDGWIDWPGKQNRRGGVYDKWIFWQGCDIDLSLIFEGDEVAELILSADEALTIPDDALLAAPFQVTVNLCMESSGTDISDSPYLEKGKGGAK